jgi:protein phosphatase
MKTIRTKSFDIGDVSLCSEEGFVLSRVVDAVSLKELVDLSGLAEERVLEVLRRLVEQGTVEVEPPLEPLFETSARGMSIAVCGATDVGIARSNNEDAFKVVDLGPRGTLLLVCDGMGGENAGEVASALAVEAITEHLATSEDDDLAAALRCAVEHANALVQAAADVPSRRGMGTTVVAALVAGAEVFTAEVGDSRAYVLRGGSLTQITKDQTYVQLLLEQGLVAPEAIEGSVAKHVVLQALGKAPTMIVAQRRLALRSGDQLLLCSDGLSSFVTDAEIRDVLLASASLHEACASLVAAANGRGGHDNVTVLAALLGAPLPAPASFEGVAETLTTIRAYAVGEPDGGEGGPDSAAYDD